MKDDDEDGEVPVREEFFTDPNTGAQRRLVYFADGNYREYDLDDPNAPQVPVADPVTNVEFERKRNGGWQKRTTFASGSYNLDDVTDDEVPAELRAPAPDPAQPQAPAPDISFSESEQAPAPDISFSETEEEQRVQSFSETEQSEQDAEGDDAGEGDDDPAADFLQQARGYLQTAGHRAFADWMRTLPSHAQDQLIADPELGAVWRQENAAPAAPAWQPAENDWAAAATANAASVDALDDRGVANFSLAGFSLLIGGGHDTQHAGWVGGAGDVVAGSVTVRKAGVGRGAGSLTFTGVPPAKQEVVRAAVARFSRKEVRFS